MEFVDQWFKWLVSSAISAVIKSKLKSDTTDVKIKDLSIKTVEANLGKVNADISISVTMDKKDLEKLVLGQIKGVFK